jgi:hypothetical protein
MTEATEIDPVQQERENIAKWLRGLLPHSSTLRPINDSISAMADHQSTCTISDIYHNLAWLIESDNYATHPTP